MTPQYGQFGLSRGKSLLAKSILLFMWTYCKLVIKKPTDSLWNHAFLIIKLYNEPYVLEANSKAIKERWFKNPFTMTIYYHDIYKNCVKITKWEHTEYAKGEVEYILMNMVIPWTSKEINLMTQLALYFEGRPYDYSEILCQIVKGLTGVEIGKDGKAAEHALICSELDSTVANHLRPGWSDNPAKDNPMDIRFNVNLKL
jgi:hypothetical protein